MRALAVGGVEDHVHILLLLPSVLSIAKAMQLIKSGSSKWMNEQQKGRFAWQSAYGAFTVGVSQKATAIRYIETQAKRHRKAGFEEEFVAFLKKHDMDYDPRYIWG
jgi:putative transposase